MDRATIEITIKVHPKEMRERLDQAASTARAPQNLLRHRRCREER
jgi:hypothetical protein